MIKLFIAFAILAAGGPPISANETQRSNTGRDRFILGERPFAPTSSWNTPIELGATYEKLDWPLTARFGVAWKSYSPAVHIALKSDPVVIVSHPASWGYPANNLKLHIPADADGSSGTDGELLVIDGNIVHNFWQFKRQDAENATARSYASTNVAIGSGWGCAAPFLGAGIVAAGSSQLAGLLVQAETDRGEIEHALQISIDARLAKPGFAYPAINGDGRNANGLAQEGERLAIPPEVTMPQGLSPLGQKVFRAYQRYGAYIIDVADGITHLRAQANAYDDSTMIALQQDLSRVSPLLQHTRSDRKALHNCIEENHSR